MAEIKKNSPETGLEIAVIGMAGKFPGAKNLEEFWKNLENGEESISFFSNEELIECGISEALLNQPNYVKAYGVIEAREYFDASFFGYSPKEAETLDPLIRLFHECSWEALENAGYDSMSYNGSIGVYAGASDGFGWQVALRLKNIKDQTEDIFGHMTDCSLLISSRVSHKLNLKGPSITLFTACSTGLVAIHTACRALLTGECDMALAGAGSVLSSGKTGYLYQESMILSPDGHCRTFDEKAKGTLYGEGVGVVLLKRVKDARTDGDTIKCIIKASAVNNDGTGKASFTAPGKKRIADVIRTVMKLARVEPDDVGCIEAHGTATALGDAIEFEALKEAFDTDKKGFCGIGSIKTNIGHLDVAAGMAGFIKAALAIIHKHIPPSLHFEIPNPDIDFIDSPFYINNELAQWGSESGGYPLRAGVCSFGVGGTNAFILLEGVTPPAPVQDKKPQLLLLSARTDSALDTMTHNLAQYFKKNSSNNGLLADVAYTLQVGRRVFSRRRMLVCSTVEQAIEALSLTGNDNNDNNGRVRTSAAKGKGRPLDQGLMDKLVNAFQSVEPAGEAEVTLNEIGMAWLNGAKIPWQEFYAKYLKDSGQRRYRIPLPTYPFEKERFWFDIGPLEFSTPGPIIEREKEGVKAAALEEEVTAGLYPRPPLSTEYAAPRDDVEQALVGVWQKFFGIREVGIDDDFFELGGDSLKVITVVTEIHKRMNTRVPVTEIFQSPTIKKLAQYIKGAEKVEYSAIESVEEREYYLLSSVQKRLYILYQMDPGSTGYHDTLFFEVEGQPDKECLEKVFDNLVTRHESLRTSFELINGESVQRIHDDVDFEIEYYEAAGEIGKIQDSFVRPFDLSGAPLLRVGLMGITIGDKHILMVDMHHIITDGSSIGILIREFITLYTGGALPSLRIRYKDYTQWQNSEKQREVIKKQEAYWLRVFEDEIPVLNLPIDFVRPAIQDFEGSTRTLIIPREETEALKKVASNQDATLFMILLSVYNVLLAKICGQEDIVVGIPVAARTHADLQHVIGMFVNTLALRNYPLSEKTFREFLMETRENTLAAFENQDYLFEDLVEQVTETGKWNRDTSRNPVFDTLFNILNIQSQFEANLEIKSPGLSLKPYEYKKETSEFDLIFQGGEEIDGLSFTVFFRTRLFKPETIDRFIGYFKRIISCVCENVEIFLSNIEILSPGEKKQLVVDFNRTEMAYPREKRINHLFEEQVEKNPDRIVLVCREESTVTPLQLTYRELDQRADRLAQVLPGRGIGPDVIVGIMMEHSVDMITGILGILKAGGAFLPLDPDFPRDRIDYMLNDSKAKILLTNLSEAHLHHSSNRFINRHPGSLAYAIYTSGSTGGPKGVLIEHRNITNQLCGLTGLYSFAPSLRHILTAPFTFDPSVQELFLPLITGGTLFTVSKSTKTNPSELLDYIVLNHIRLLDAVPTLIEMLVDNIGDYKGLRLEYLILAGEVFSNRLHRKIRENLQAEVIINIYGPTEATINTTYYQCQPEEIGASVPIGSPLPNYKVFIVDKDMNIQPPGLGGELLIGGEGVARGYLNNPGLTAEKFIEYRSYRSYRTYIFYRTGDLARWLTEGNLEFLGRLDQQVKIRGQRVELGEIESCLRTLEGIKEAVVIIRSGEGGEKYLCAYVAAKNESGLNVSHLRQELAARLPGHMIPSHFIEIDQIPLTSSGKVDRRALPGPDTSRPQLASDYLASAAPMEKLIAGTWQDILKIDKIGINDNFFDLGGDSISLVKVIVKLRKILNTEIPTKLMFQYPTVHMLAQHINEAERTGIFTTEKKEHLGKPGLKTIPEKMKYRAIEPVEIKEYYSLSSGQKRLYILQQMNREYTAYNMSDVQKLEQGIDKDKLVQVFREIIRRHESFRTAFITVNEELVQQIHDKVEFEIEYLTAKSAKDREEIITNFIRPFDLSKAPLLRVGLIDTPETGYLLATDIHHVVFDAASQEILKQEFATLRAGKELPPLPLQYKDYSEWQISQRQQEIMNTQEKYWLKELSGELPIINLPTDYPRPLIQNFEGRNLRFLFNKEITDGLKELSRKTGATLYMVLLSVFNVLLSRLSGQEDIIVGTPMAGRRHDDLQNIIGMFVNTLSMRNYPGEEKRFSEFLEEVKERTLEVYENQEYPFEELVNKVSVRRDTGRNPIFDVVFNFLSKFDVQDNIKTIDPDDIADLGEFKAIFDITLQASEQEGLLYLTVDYCTKIYRVETIKRFITFFKRITAEIIKNPTQQISSIDIISGEEKKQILVEFNDTAVEYPGEKTIHRLFEEQAEKTPDNIAAIGKKENARLTYNELNERSDQLSYILREKGVLADDIIGIMVERSIEMLIDILGILKAGGAYLPVDPEYPQERIDYMLKDSGAKLLMNTNNLEAPDFHLLPAASHRQPATSLAYVIYTSGSTGVPKGVMVDHGAVVNLLFAMQEAYPCRESHTWLLKTSYMFDVSVTELFGWFLGGGQLVVLQKGGEKDPYLLLDIIKEQKITHINFVPVMFTALVNILNAKNIGELSGLRYIFLAGEVLPAYPVNRLRQFTAYPQMENLYGPTEATVYASGYSLSVWDGSGSIPIGRPFGNVKLYIIGKRGLLQPVGVAGELCISGAGVARGYLNNPELTAEKFTEYRSYRSYGTYTFYNTGDLARWLPDGNIEFLGRIDFQVKIRGFRIELGEIENQLLKIEGISEAIVIDRKDTIDQGYLCAYIVSSLEINSQELKNALARVLPDYMIPSYVMQVDKIPFTPNGKVDRQALPLPGWETEDQTPKAPRNEIEEKMVEIWADVLGIKKELIGINRNFFELGGHSLKATIMTIKIHEAFNIRIPLEEIFKAPTVEGICSLISVAKWINEQDRDQERPPNNEDEEIIL